MKKNTNACKNYIYTYFLSRTVHLCAFARQTRVPLVNPIISMYNILHTYSNNIWIYIFLNILVYYKICSLCLEQYYVYNARGIQNAISVDLTIHFYKLHLRPCSLNGYIYIYISGKTNNLNDLLYISSVVVLY